MERRHYLIIALDVAATAPGIVFKTLIRSLAQSCDVTLMAQAADTSFLPQSVSLIPLHNGVENWGRAQKKWRRYACNPRDIFWSVKTWLKYRKTLRKNHYDAVVTLTSNGYYASLNLGNLVARRLGCPYMIYSVDGMPSPLPWLNQDVALHRNISKELVRLCSSASLFISSNPFMMEYQKTVIPKLKGRWDYLYTPYRPLPESFSRKEHEGYNLLYAGSLYGLRKIDGLLEAFRAFLQKRPNARLWFVGECVPQYKEMAQDLSRAGKLLFRDPTPQIDEYYSTADCLIDIAADIPDDVFLSSKVICYLPYNIPILTISGAHSPVSSIMRGAASIAHCPNNAQEILSALESLETVHSFADREALLKEFSPEHICQRFKSMLEK